MQTKQQIERSFRAELQALLDKYGAALEAKDHYPGYAECGEDVRMTVSIPGVWSQDGETVSEHTEIDLGSNLWPTPNADLTVAEGSSPKATVESTVMRMDDWKMYDVIAVNMTTHKVRMIGENKTERNADAIGMMAVARPGCDEEFFTKAPSGKYKEGDEWNDSDET